MDDLANEAFLAFDARFDPDAAAAHQQHQQQYQQLPNTTSASYHLASVAAASTWPLTHDDMSHQINHNSMLHSGLPVSQPPTDSDNDTSRSHSSTALTSTALASRPATTTAPALSLAGLGYHTALDPSTALMTSTDWSFPLQHHASSQGFIHDPNNFLDFTGTYGLQLQNSPVDVASSSPVSQSLSLSSSLGIDPNAYLPFTTSMDMHTMAAAMTPFGMNDFQNEIMSFPLQNVHPMTTASDFLTSSIPAASSPAESLLELQSISGRSDGSWYLADVYPAHPTSSGISPQALHIRTDSTASKSSSDGPLSASTSSWDDLTFPFHSPEPDNLGHELLPSAPNGLPLFNDYSPSTYANTGAISSSPSSASPASSAGASPVLHRRRNSPVSPITGITPKAIVKPKSISKQSVRPSATATAAANAVVTGGKKDGASSGVVEKKVGRRKGPLRPDQRQQAHEIRKLRACLRCKFLKKVCDKGSPCGGCQPSHQRLWQVPCTRIDIKDIGYFLKDWKADYERHVSLGFSVGNIKGFSHHERTIYVTHGYGFFFPISAREVYVRDDKCFGVDWVESIHETPRAYEVVTAKLSAGINGVGQDVLAEYLDRYVDAGFEKFVDEYFEGSLFLSEMLKTVHRFWVKTQNPVIKKALRMVLAYNLTLHITMVEGLTEEEAQVGIIEDETSRFKGKTCAPVMINFQVKCALAEMWRNLMKDILEELSSLYSSVYTGERLKNWPTIFMLAIVLLLVWEEMQFDCHYRVPDQEAVKKFCTEMEGTPVGVVVGLFQAMSTKLPGFLDWDTRKHGHVWSGNQPVCDALTEVRGHVGKYEGYLKTRNEAKFDRDDFDSLSNKFLAKLVIRPTAAAH